LKRIVGKGGFEFEGVVIPKGAIIYTSPHMATTDEKLWDKLRRFGLER